MESGKPASWRHDMEMFATLLALCEGNPLVTRASNVELKWFLSSQTEHAAEQMIEFPVIWDWHSCYITVQLLCKDGWMKILHWPDYLFNGWDSHQTNGFKDMYWIIGSGNGLAPNSWQAKYQSQYWLRFMMPYGITKHNVLRKCRILSTPLRFITANM